jgi:hypothetical protein
LQRRITDPFHKLADTHVLSQLLKIFLASVIRLLYRINSTTKFGHLHISSDAHPLSFYLFNYFLTHNHP